MSSIALAQASSLDEWSSLDSPLHRLEARSKTITTFFFMITVMSFPRYDISALMPLVAYPAFLLTLGNLPIGRVVARVALAAPLAIMIGIFNPLFDTQPLLQLGNQTISGGWLSFVSILIRYILTLTAVLALVGCTGIHRLCAGFAQLGLPRAFAMQILFLYRYLFVVAGEGDRMRRGAALRLSGQRLALPVFASLVGHLLLRSLDRAQRIYQAMLARGFDGTIRLAAQTPWTIRDTVFVTGWTLFFVVVRCWDVAGVVGTLTMGEGP